MRFSIAMLCLGLAACAGKPVASGDQNVEGLATTTSGTVEATVPSGKSTAEAPAVDKKRIRAFAGCFEVGFNFAETFPVAKDYERKSPYRSGATELVFVDFESPTEVHLQHVLVVGKEGRRKALKHWRQEWVYEPQEILDFKGLNRWERRKLSPAESEGRWLQRVTQVDDAPRYECAAPWVESAEGAFWECRSWNPLPRREYTTRTDYQVLQRLNRQRLRDDGWVHEQDAVKIVLKGNRPEPLVQERGENTYRKISDRDCRIAKTWWLERRDQWRSVRASWKGARDRHPNLTLNFQDAEGDLWKKLFALDDQAAREKWIPERLAQESDAVIESSIRR